MSHPTPLHYNLSQALYPSPLQYVSVTQPLYTSISLSHYTLLHLNISRSPYPSPLQYVSVTQPLSTSISLSHTALRHLHLAQSPYLTPFQSVSVTQSLFTSISLSHTTPLDFNLSQSPYPSRFQSVIVTSITPFHINRCQSPYPSLSATSYHKQHSDSSLPHTKHVDDHVHIDRYDDGLSLFCHDFTEGDYFASLALGHDTHWNDFHNHSLKICWAYIVTYILQQKYKGMIVYWTIVSRARLCTTKVSIAK